jgi:predicted dehydrogenase
VIDDPIRWGILGTAGIAEGAFLPALSQAGDGVAVSVASRDGARARSWAAEHDITGGVAGYEEVVSDPEIEAIYIPLPNGLHAEWTIAALEAGKAVLCEKPLCVTLEETRRVLATADAASVPLWEAFVFPFHQQIERVHRALAAGQIGEVREIVSRFHFVLDDRRDIRLSAELGGGSLYDVGCYPIRLARLLFEAEPDLDRAIADAVWTTSGVDSELWGALTFPGNRRLVFSCGFVTADDTFTRVFGTDGELRMTNPFHPGDDDAFAIVHGDEVQEQAAAPAGQHSFTPAIRHIHAVLRGREQPRHLAMDEAMGNATAITALLGAAGRSPA